MELIVVVHVRFVRVEVEVVRVVAIVLCGRPIVAVVLHIVHIGAVAVARSRQEANLAFLGLNVAGRIPQQTSGNGFLLYIPKMGEMLDLLIFTL